VVNEEIASGKFITMAYLAVAADGAVTAASAGHPPPRLVAPDGRIESLPAGGLALGIDPNQHYAESRGSLARGASVVLFTDGVTEARSGGEVYGEERLDELLRASAGLRAQQLADAVLDDCRAHAGGELGDDCAVVVIRRT
jgi:serine phosphatase RsbU (regulator of sigma subunit)